MKHIRKRAVSVLLAAALLITAAVIVPFGASAAGGETTINITSNLFGDSSVVVSDWTRYEDKEKNAFISVEFKLYAEEKYLIGVELDKLTWDPEVLEYREEYNMAGTGRNAHVCLFPFAYEQGFGFGVVNTFGDNNGGKITGNYSAVSASDPYAATAYTDEDSAVTLVKAVFRVLDKTAASTDITCDFRVLSLDDDDTDDPQPNYCPILNKVINVDYMELADFETVAQAIVPKPFLAGNVLTVLANGMIDIKFYLTIKDENLTDNIGDCAVRFSWGEEGTVFGAQTKEGTFTQSGGYYITKCSVYAPEMTDLINMKMFDPDGNQVLSCDYGVKSYVERAGGVAYADPLVRKLLCDMLDYGAATQLHFHYRENDLATDYMHYVDSDIIGDPEQRWSRNIVTSLPDETTFVVNDTDLADYGLRYEGSMMSTKDIVEIYVYFSVTDAEKFSGTTAYRDNRRLAFTDSSGMKRIRLTNIVADKLFDRNDITFRNGTNTATRCYSAARYYNNTMNSAQSSQTHKDVMQTMYNYSQSTAAYVASKTGV